MSCILDEERVNLLHVVVASKLDGQIPLVEVDADVDGLLVLAATLVSINSLLAETNLTWTG